MTSNSKTQFAAFRWLALALVLAGPLRAEADRTIVFFGDSLTAGYGLADPAAEAYPAVIEQKIAAARLPWRVVNAGLSGETVAGGLRRVDWILRQPVDLFVLALGANDGLRGIAPEETASGLRAIIGRVRARYPSAQIVLAGMRMPDNMGPDYTRAFDEIFPAVAREEHTALIPFLLDGSADGPSSTRPTASTRPPPGTPSSPTASGG